MPLILNLFAYLLILLLSCTAVEITYDNVYGQAVQSVNTLACSSSDSRFQKYGTFGKIPNFPFIGGSPNIGKADEHCLTCWELAYQSNSGNWTTVTILLVDRADSGFNIATEAMDALTGGRAEELGRIQGLAKGREPGECGL